MGAPGRWLVGSLLLIVLLGLAFWLLLVPHWRPPLSDGEVYGVDVSHHQGEIDWPAVADDGIEFAYIKASEGGDFPDRFFEQNWRGAKEAGVLRGVYHFFTLCRPGGEQAEWFLTTAPPEPDTLPPAVDLELAGNCAARPDAEEVYRELDSFLDAVEQAWGQEAVLYVGNDWEDRYPVQDSYDRRLWLRRFLIQPHQDWWIWQLHGYAQIDGIHGDADLNVGRLD